VAFSAQGGKGEGGGELTAEARGGAIFVSLRILSLTNEVGQLSRNNYLEEILDLAV